jgi:hypothetical protein
MSTCELNDSAAAGSVFSDGCDDDLVVLAECAMVGAQIETGFLRFDARQQQQPAASGTGWAKPIDEFISGDVWHELAPTGGSVQHSLSPMKAGYGAVISDRILIEAQSDSIRTNLAQARLVAVVPEAAAHP